MAATKRLAINVVMNWASMAVNMVVPFFLTPFVVRHLGPVGYGVWILAVSTVGYLNLLDLGLRSAVIRFVSKAQAKGEMDEASKAIHAALWFRLLIASGVAVFSIILAAAVPHFFKIPSDLMRAAQITTLLCAIGVAISLVSGVFGAVLAAISRFDILSYITMGQTVTRAVGVLWILHHGHGLVPLACWELTVITLVATATTIASLIAFPHSRVKPSKPDMGVLRMIWSYSMTTFVFVIAIQIITNTDNLVVGAFLSVGVVTFYALGGSLINYATQVSGALSATFVPMASNLEASGKAQQLRTMVLRGTQGTLCIALPISAVLFFRGGTFIRLWMGPQYAVVSENVVRILMISMYFSVADCTASAIMLAIDKHKVMARWAVYEAMLNLGLSLLLVKKIGLYGVAWGTAIAIVCIHVSFWPRYVRETLNVPIKTYVWQGWGKITLCVVPFAAVCALTDKAWPAAHMVTFFAQVLVLLPLYALTVFAAFRRECMEYLQKWFNSRKARLVTVA